MFKIISAPNHVLSETAKPVGKIDKSILSLIEEMKVTLENTRDPEGVGLAAPQIGKSLQLFIIKPTPKSPIEIFINPVLETFNVKAFPLQKEDEKISENQRKSANSKKLEGCLSLPQVWGEVHRVAKVKLSYQDESGKKRHKTFKGFQATIIQHEYDHLQGILFPKRVLEQSGQLYKSHKNEKGKDVFEEIEL